MASFTYIVGVGWDLDDVDMDVVVPQPTVSPAAPVARDYGAGPAVHDQGLWTCYHFDFVDEDDYLALLTQFGLDTNTTAEVSIYAKNERLQMTRYNGIAQLPQMGDDIKWQNFFPRDVNIYIVDLQEAEVII